MPSPRPRRGAPATSGGRARRPAAGAPEVLDGTVSGRISTTAAAARKADSDPPGPHRRATLRHRARPGA
jgi:hypothetical protein